MSKEQREERNHRLLWVNERILRTWVSDLEHTLVDAESQLTLARESITLLEKAVEGWRAVADRKPKFVNRDHANCACGGIGCTGCCGAQ